MNYTSDSQAVEIAAHAIPMEIEDIQAFDSQIIASALDVLRIEAEAIEALAPNIDDKFVQACKLLLACKGRIAVSGVGKSGHIARKIAATLSSTGSPAFFIHPSEACHGDLGMLTKEDVFIAISYSGEAHELLTLLPRIKQLKIPLISLCKPNSTLAQLAHVNLDVSISKEACPLGLAPTASTTVSLAMGDAVAIALLQAKGFTTQDFAYTHPGGLLGKRLLLQVADIMQTGDAIPRVNDTALISDALLEMSKKCLGMTTVVHASAPHKMIGVFTDGDLRRILNQNIDIRTTPISQVMTKSFKSILPTTLAIEALNVLENHLITALAVLDNNNNLVGTLNIHDLFRAGIK